MGDKIYCAYTQDSCELVGQAIADAGGIVGAVLVGVEGVGRMEGLLGEGVVALGGINLGEVFGDSGFGEAVVEAVGQGDRLGVVVEGIVEVAGLVGDEAEGVMGGDFAAQVSVGAMQGEGGVAVPGSEFVFTELGVQEALGVEGVSLADGMAGGAVGLGSSGGVVQGVGAVAKKGVDTPEVVVGVALAEDVVSLGDELECLPQRGKRVVELTGAGQGATDLT